MNKICYGLLVLSLIASVWFSHPIWAWLILVNVLTFLIYGADKFAARRDWRRVPERILLAYGLLGGWPGGLVAQQLFRHKTQKQPFKRWFTGSIVVNVLMLVGVAYLSGYWHV